ncbi:hypothetical protein [Cryptosporangium arvum]|uniref:site-specific DNA-methyltransferase (adenine-specific) n=1 Tax=Cryptosporangium arvum DSM 44712 TaxID=927661 RepID=A0A011AJ22_9ACTN|nr:hypothetical protein [Cryptosporangium arvum]EXG82021.1 hypothetical protein CryarDRAFT_3153 [Cryptosporangium arvum DSM 44712]
MSTFDAIGNRGEYFAAHYYAERLPLDLRKGIFGRWTDRETDELEQRPTTREQVRALRGEYFTDPVRGFFVEHARLAAESLPAPDGVEGRPVADQEWAKRLTAWHHTVLRHFGYPVDRPDQVTVHRAGREHTLRVAFAGDGILAVDCGWAVDADAALDAHGPDQLLGPVRISAGESYATGSALATWLFNSQIVWPNQTEPGSPPRFVLLLVGGVLVLADRHCWGEGRFLTANLDGALQRYDRRQNGELATIAALFSYEMLRTGANGEDPAIDALLKTSTENAVGVDGDLRQGLQRSVELIANEILDRLIEAGVEPAQVARPDKPLGRELRDEALRYLYRILFLLFAEARPELGILPSDDGSYEAGYSLARLRELVARDEELIEGNTARGFHLYESLNVLFCKVNKGHRAYGTEAGDYQPGDDEATRKAKKERRSEDRGLRFEPLRSALFEPTATRLIGCEVPDPRSDDIPAPRLDLRLRNGTLHRVLRLLTMKRPRGKERGGFISYRNLGINQLGAVYEGLMSYTGFLATEELYEVAKGGNPKDGSWMVPSSQIGQFTDDSVFVRYDQADERRGLRGWKRHPRGSFVYRLAGRERQVSASYYTPESLTKLTVELALKHRLDQDRDANGATVETRAAELLQYRICEPALGSGAFLNEAINQLASEYLRRRQNETGKTVPTADALTELQRVKAYIALHNSYGVDLNATAVELAEVSLWLNTMHPGMRAPWFGLHLRRGNSLIGARRAVYTGSDAAGRNWLASKNPLPPTELPFRAAVENTDADAIQPLPVGAIHQFLLPATGWGTVAGESEAKALAPEAAARLGRWRKGILKPPKTTGGQRSELARLQGTARRVEFLWDLVVERMRISEREIARRIDVWGANPDDHEYVFIQRPEHPVPKEKVYKDLFEKVGTPYWRLKTLMDAWCALWFWPVDQAALLDGDDPAYEQTPVTPAQLSELLGVGRGEQVALFSRDVEQMQLLEPVVEETKPDGKKKRKEKPKILRDARIAMKELANWIDFAEALVGTEDMPEDSLASGFKTLKDLDYYEKLIPGLTGMDEELQLQARFPWLDKVESIAEERGFFHWELHFALVFAERGGFDLQIGNPPWVRPDWDEPAVLAEFDPWFKLAEKADAKEKEARRADVIARQECREYVLAELTGTSASVAWLRSPHVYPLAAGTRPDLYRAFMCQTWAHTAVAGTVGLLHPDSHLAGVGMEHIRAEAYRRLRVHGDFVNAGNRFFPPPVGRSSHFGLHVYGTPGETSFDHLSWLFSVDALRHSYRQGVPDEGILPGIRFDGDWDTRPHPSRVIHVNAELLAVWQGLTGDESGPAEYVRLLSPVSIAENRGIESLAGFPVRLATLLPQISGGYNEATAKSKGLIRYEVSEPSDWKEVVLKGPQIGVATPLFKQPTQGSGEVLGLDLTTLPADALPATEYRNATDRARFEAAQDRWIDHPLLERLLADPEELSAARVVLSEAAGIALDAVPDGDLQLYLTEKARRRCTEFYRVAWRKMIAPDTERSLYVALLPPGPSHIDGIRSAVARDNRSTTLLGGFWSALPVDYFLRTTGIGDLHVASAIRLPAPIPDHPLARALLIRTSRLNCLTAAYADLWPELHDRAWRDESWANGWDGLPPLGDVKPEWDWNTPLRTDRARRAALVEIDALVAVWLGVDAAALEAMYRARFPIMADFDEVTWFDATGRRLAGNRYAYGHGQTKEHFEQLQAYLADQRRPPESRQNTPAPDGYTPPFYKADRVNEMKAAHAVFQARLDEAIAAGEWDPVTHSRPGVQNRAGA